MMRVAMIGGTKFIGPYVVSQLADQGHQVVVYHRGQTEAALPQNVRHIHSPAAGIPVTSFAPELLDGTYDVIVHMIAMGEADARAAVEAFSGRAERLVVPSSGDVYLAYARFTRSEPGPPLDGLLREDSPLRGVFYPYRAEASPESDWTRSYEKILVEQIVLGDPDLSATVLRLPKVYGPGGNADLKTVHSFRNHPDWRWTHGYVENVAAAITLAATHPKAAGRVYNVGEPYTPTVAERLAALPGSCIPIDDQCDFDFRQDIAYDTSRIREELGYREPIPYEVGLRRTVGSGLYGGMGLN
jgi:nucleoside-diphosphate-sugar epimerase